MELVTKLENSIYIHYSTSMVRFISKRKLKSKLNINLDLILGNGELCGIADAGSETRNSK